MFVLRGSREVEALSQLIHRPRPGGLPCRGLAGSRPLLAPPSPAGSPLSPSPIPDLGAAGCVVLLQIRASLKRGGNRRPTWAAGRRIFSSWGFHVALPSPISRHRHFLTGSCADFRLSTRCRGNGLRGQPPDSHDHRSNLIVKT